MKNTKKLVLISNYYKILYSKILYYVNIIKLIKKFLKNNFFQQKKLI